jgi:hypothetical protein
LASAVLAVAALVVFLAERVHLPPAHGSVWPTVLLFGGAWLAFAAAVWLVRKLPIRAAVALILLGGVAAGVACASAPERTSDDLYRYVWDGRVQAAGIDPYDYVPAAPQLTALRDPSLWPARSTNWCIEPGAADPDGGLLVPGCSLINRPAVHTIYPPVAEAYFLGVHALSPPGSRYKPIQLAAVLLALATTVTLLLGLRALGRDPRLAALWAWCPVVAFETGNGAHVDVLAALLTAGGLPLLALAARNAPGSRAATRRYLLGSLLLGLGTGAKLTPAMAVPAVLRRRPLLIATTVAGAFVAVYLPHVVAVGGKVLGFIPGYLHEQGYATGGGFMLLDLLLPDAWAAVAAVLIVAAAALTVLLRADPHRPWRGTLTIVGVTMFVTTPVFQWYSILPVVLVALDGRLEWLALALPVFISQITQPLGFDRVNSLRFGYGLALLVVLAGTALRSRRRRSRADRLHTATDIHSAAFLEALPTPSSTDREPAVPLVDVVLPCLNEEGALPYVLERLPDGYRAIVVDNGSTDGSARLAEQLGALVVTEQRRGFGAACHAGLAAATAPVVCFCDCDGSLDPRQLPRVAGPVLAGESDLVLGRRRPVGAGAWPPHARLANQVLAFRLRRAGVQVRDLGPMRAARREALFALGVADRRSGYPLETVLAAARAGWRIDETVVDYAPRTGKSKVTGTLTGTLQAVRDMNRVWREATSR